MSVVAQQHERWRLARGRLGLPMPPHGEAVVARLKVPERWTYPPIVPYDHYEPPRFPGDPTLDRAATIVEMIAHKHGLTIEALWSIVKLRRYSRARNEAYYRLKKDTALTIGEIAKLMRRDHTTVLSGIDRHEAALSA